MNVKYPILFLLATVLVTGSRAQKATKFEQQTMKLWYKQPADQSWESALPLGNGRLGAMVYGNVQNEVIGLNESTVWSGSPNRNDNILALQSLPALRRLIFAGENAKAQKLANQTIISKTSQGQMYEPVGDLKVDFDPNGTGSSAYTRYYRELSLDSAVSTTTYRAAGVDYKRVVFVSKPDQVIVMHLTASKDHAISFTARYATPVPGVKVAAAGNELILEGVTIDHESVKGKVRFKAVSRFVQSGGTIRAHDTSLQVQGASSVTVFISIATNVKSYQDLSADEGQRVKEYLDKAGSKSYNDLLHASVVAYKKYFDRVKIALGDNSSNVLPTDQRLAQFAKKADPGFAALFYQYGRYLLISASQPGGQPATLQGLWNHSLFPPWDSKYTININTEMNYWPAEKTNLAAMHEPLLDMVRQLAVTGSKTARDMYGARGWMAHHNTDLWRTTGAVDGAFWGIWSNGGGWLSEHLWEHYLYNGDKNYLKRVYPVMKGAALFYRDVLVEDPTTHYMVLCPDMSPENAPASHQGASIAAGTTMSNQIIFDVFSKTIRAAEVLHTDAAFVDTLRKLRSELSPMHIGQFGQLQEWQQDLDNPTDHHRHISQLYGLFPSNQISAYRTPDLFSAASVTLQERGDVSTGWSMAWKINWWARMQDGNHAYRLLQNQLSPVGLHPEGGGTYNNLFDAHPPFQIDGNYGCTSGITEMLMQSADDNIDLLPALPDVWPTGHINGLRAPGGFVIRELSWENNQVVKVVIHSKLGGNLRIRVPNRLSVQGQGALKATDLAHPNSNPFYYVERTPKAVIAAGAPIQTPKLKTTYLYDLATKKGKTYVMKLK